MRKILERNDEMIKKVSIMVTVFALVITAVCIIGCGTKTVTEDAGSNEVTEEVTEDTGSTEVVAGDEKVVSGWGDISDELYVYVGIFNAHPVLQSAMRSFKQAGIDFGVQTQIVGPNDWGVENFINAFEQTIVQKPAGIVTIPLEPSVEALIDKAMDAGIPVATIDSDLPDSKRICHVGTNWDTLGKKLAEATVNLLDGKGQVAMMGNIVPANMQQGFQGFRDYMEDYPEIEIVTLENSEALIDVAAAAASAIMQAYPDIDAIVGFDGSCGMGICPAVKEAGKSDEIMVVLNDILPEHIEYLKDGSADFILGQKHPTMTAVALQMLISVNHSSVKYTNDDKSIGVYPVPEVLEVGFLEINADNIDLYTEAMAAQAAIKDEFSE